MEKFRITATRWLVRRDSDFATSKASDDTGDEDDAGDETQASIDDEERQRRIDGHAKATDKLVAGYVPDLTEKLIDARAAVEESVLAAAPSGSSFALVAAELKALQSAIDLIDGTGYVDVLYTTAQELVEVGWDGARELLDIQTGFDVPPVWAMEHVEEAARHVGAIVADNDKKTLTAVLEEAMLRGWSASDTSDALRAAFASGITSYDDDGNETRKTKSSAYWKMVARTELQRAAVQGQVALYKEVGVEKVRWQVAEPCDECAVAEEAGSINLGDTFPGVEVDAPPAHPNCAPAGTLIASARGWIPIEEIRVGDFVLTHRQRFRMVRALSRTMFSEDLFELRVGSNILRVTGNHPIYTGDRWTAAASLQPGDEVACVQAEAMLRAALEAQQIPAECPQCGRLHLILGALAGSAVPRSSIDLDGKEVIGEGNVNAQGAKGEIWEGVDAGFQESIKNNALIGRFNDSRAIRSTQAQLREGTLLAANGVMSRRGKGESFFGSRASHAGEHGFGQVAPGQSKSPESSHDGDAAMSSAELNRKSENAFASQMSSVHLSDLIVSEDASIGASEGLPSHIAIVSLSSVARIPHAGLVYNFAVDQDESYIAEGVVVHNCRCVLVPADEKFSIRARRLKQESTEES